MSFGNLYKIPFTATLRTNPYDLVGILAPNNSQVVLREFLVGAVSTSQPQGQLFQISIFRGSTASSTSAGITPMNILPQSSPAPLVAGSSVTGPSSGLVSTASATLIHTPVAVRWIKEALVVAGVRTVVKPYAGCYLIPGKPSCSREMDSDSLGSSVSKSP